MNGYDDFPSEVKDEIIAKRDLFAKLKFEISYADSMVPQRWWGKDCAYLDGYVDALNWLME